MLSTMLGLLVPSVGVVEVLLAVVALLLARHYYKTAGYWERRGVPAVAGVPLLGSAPALMLHTEYRGITMKRFYDKARAKGQPCVGLYLGSAPALLVVDNELVRAVMAKDFATFPDRGVAYDRKNEPLTANLFNLEGAEWRSLRHKLTPTFSSGRMRAMFPLVQACAEELDAVLAVEAKRGEPVEMLEMLARFNTDVIGTCAFGIQANALKDPGAVFRTMGKRAFKVSPLQLFFIIVAPSLLPIAKKFFPIRLISKDVTEFFTNVFNENFEHRQRNNVTRHDFVDLLLQLKTKGKLNQDGDDNDKADGETNGHGQTNGTSAGPAIDEDILPAQAFIFFVAGFETSSSALGNCMTELAYHPEEQAKARAEVQRVLAKHDGQLTYEALHELVYLEQVIDETMRLYPAAANMARVASQNYTLPVPVSGDASPSVVAKGTKMIIPTFAIHRDPEYYPDPDRFNPDNFSEEAKKGRPNYTFMPFGEGPRICIGLRFAMMQMKAALATVLRNYHVSPVEDANDYPARFQASTFVTQTIGGNKVHVRRL